MLRRARRAGAGGRIASNSMIAVIVSFASPESSPRRLLSLSLSHRRVGLPSPILPRLARYAWIILPRFMLILGPAGRPTEFERVPSSKKGEVSLSKMLHKMLHGSEGIRRIGPTALVEVRTSNPPSMRTRCRLLECRLLWFLRYNILSSWRFSSA